MKSTDARTLNIEILNGRTQLTKVVFGKENMTLLEIDEATQNDDYSPEFSSLLTSIRLSGATEYRIRGEWLPVDSPDLGKEIIQEILRLSPISNPKATISTLYDLKIVINVKHEERVLGDLSFHFLPTDESKLIALDFAASQIFAKMSHKWISTIDFTIVETTFTGSISNIVVLLKDLVYVSGTSEFTADYNSLIAGLKHTDAKKIKINETIIFLNDPAIGTKIYDELKIAFGFNASDTGSKILDIVGKPVSIGFYLDNEIYIGETKWVFEENAIILLAETNMKKMNATINTQQSKAVQLRLRVIFNPITGIVDFQMSQTLQGTSLMSGISGLGIATAFQDLLKSDNVISFKSGVKTLERYDENGQERSDEDLKNDSTGLILGWFPNVFGKFSSLVGNKNELIVVMKNSVGLIYEAFYSIDFSDAIVTYFAETDYVGLTNPTTP